MPEKHEVNKTQLVVVALHALGGEADLEHIAVKAYEMFPQQFCWRSFPQYPDKDAVRVHLSEAKKKSFGALVTDRDLRTQRRGKDGYVKRFALTPAGQAAAEALRGELDKARAQGALVGASHNSLEYKRLVLPITESEAYEQFSDGRAMQQIGRDSFLHAFRLFPDATTFIVTGRINRAAAAVRNLGPEERRPIEAFIKEGRDAFRI